MSNRYDSRRELLVEQYADRLETEKPCDCGDKVRVQAISGIPFDEYYPMKGTVSSVRPRQLTNGRLGAEWVVRVSFTEDGCNGAVHDGTTALYAVGGSRRDWDEIPVEVI